MKTFAPLFVLLGFASALFTGGCATAYRSSYLVYYEDFDGGDVWCWDLRAGWYYLDEPDYWFTRRHLPVPSHRHGHDRDHRPNRPPHPGEPPRPGTRPCYYLVGGDGSVKRSTDGANFKPYHHGPEPARADQHRPSPPAAQGSPNHAATPAQSLRDPNYIHPSLRNPTPFNPSRRTDRHAANDSAATGAPRHESIPTSQPDRTWTRDWVDATPQRNSGSSRPTPAGVSNHAPLPAAGRVSGGGSWGNARPNRESHNYTGGGRSWGGNDHPSGGQSSHFADSSSSSSSSSGGGSSSSSSSSGGWSGAGSSGGDSNFSSGNSSGLGHHSDSGHGRSPNEP